MAACEGSLPAWVILSSVVTRLTFTHFIRFFTLDSLTMWLYMWPTGNPAARDGTARCGIARHGVGVVWPVASLMSISLSNPLTGREMRLPVKQGPYGAGSQMHILKRKSGDSYRPAIDHTYEGSMCLAEGSAAGGSLPRRGLGMNQSSTSARRTVRPPRRVQRGGRRVQLTRTIDGGLR